MAVPVGKRNVPDNVSNSYLIAGARARELSLHTIKICCNKKIFLEQYQGALTDDLIKTSKDIFVKTSDANDIRVTDIARWESRKAMQVEAIALCGRMKRLIGLARALFHLRNAKASYWVGLVEETQSLLRHWHEKDCERYNSKFSGT